MNTIPVSQLVNVNPAVLAAAGTINTLTALLVTSSLDVPIGTIGSFASAASVGSFFGLASNEYLFAQPYFAGPDNSKNKPSTLLIGQYPTAPVSGYLRGAPTTLTLTQLKALTGTLAITADGVLNTSASINLAAATSFSNAAALIQAGFTAPTFTVVYNAQHGAFQVISGSTGAASSVAFAAGTLAANLSLTAVTGAITSAGAIAATPNAAMAQFSSLSQAWSTFTTLFEPVLADKLSFSQWTSLQNDAYWYVGADSDVTNLIAGTTATWAAGVIAAGYDGTTVVYGNYTHSALALSWAASLNFAQLNGRSTLAYQTLSGVVPYVTDGQTSSTVGANGCNFLGSYGVGTSQYSLFQNGHVSGKYLWADSYVNQIWMRQNLQLALLTLEMSAGAIPYNSDGTSLINAACADPIHQATVFGAIRTGIALSTLQKQELIASIGSDVSGAIQSQGYYLQIVPAGSATRIARTSPGISLYYTDGQSIQSINATATEIQ